jgi:hypothetical protein
MPSTKKEKPSGTTTITRRFNIKAFKTPRFTPVKPKKAGQGLGSKQARSQTAHVVIERPVQHVAKGLSFFRVRFQDLVGKQCWLDIPRRLFARPTEVAGLLEDAHAYLPDRKQCIEKALKKMGDKPTLRLTDRLGWDDSDNGDPSFVYFGKTFGAARDTLQLDTDPNRNPALGKGRGSVEKWKAGLEAPCEFSDHIVFAIGIAASGPLYGLVGNPEPAIYHFQGARKTDENDTRIWKSSSGKTTSARAAQSMFGSCSRSELFSFNMTAAAVEETCFSCNNLVVVLDEEGAAGGGGGTIGADELAYRIIGGQGKRRSQAYSGSQGLSNRSWLVPVITTAEDDLDSEKSRRKEGARVRMVPIPFPPTHEGGMFNTVTEKRALKLISQVEATIAANFGVVMPRFLRHLAKDRTTLAADILQCRDDFVKDIGASGNSWEKRYAEKFGMVLAGARFLARYGLAPWTDQRALAAVTNLYTASRSLTVSVPQATDALLEKLRKEVSSDKRFPRVRKGESLNADQKKQIWGVIREIGDNNNVMVLMPARFTGLVSPPAVADLVLRELDIRKLLIKDADGNLRRQVLLKGLTAKRHRYVCIKSSTTVPAIAKSKATKPKQKAS